MKSAMFVERNIENSFCSCHMRPISKELKNELNDDLFYKKCCLKDEFNLCRGEIEWHHNLIFAGQQVNEKWAILPVCKRHHDLVPFPETKECLNYIMLNRATSTELVKYSKVINYVKEKERLNKIYGERK